MNDVVVRDEIEEEESEAPHRVVEVSIPDQVFKYHLRNSEYCWSFNSFTAHSDYVVHIGDFEMVNFSVYRHNGNASIHFYPYNEDNKPRYDVGADFVKSVAKSIDESTPLKKLEDEFQPELVTTVIAGSRSIKDYDTVRNCIESVSWHDEIDQVISGTAEGVDTMGEYWAEENDIPVDRMPADWEGKGQKAGKERNEKMMERASRAIIIYDGKSRGSKNAIKNAKRYCEKLEVFTIGDASTLDDFR